MNLRVPTELKERVVEYADRVGISINAAAVVLLTAGLRAERRKR